MKIPDPYFVNVPLFGDLRMEKVIVDYDYPLLSVLRDVSGERYLCMCFDTRGAQQWLLTPVTVTDLTKLLRNEITLAAPFENPDTKKVLAVRNYDTKKETFRLMDAGQVPKEDLPEPGEYLDAEAGEWEEYIETINTQRYWESVITFTSIEFHDKRRRKIGWIESSQQALKLEESVLCMAR